MKNILLASLCFFICTSLASAVSAEIYLRKETAPPSAPQAVPEQPQPSSQAPAPSKAAADYAGDVARACLGGQWEQPACLKAVSENVYVMASNYGATLQENNKNQDAGRIKEHCAAATAAAKESFPAYAMRSAYVECVNIVYDVTESTKMPPDLSQYQLLVAAVQCLDKTEACSSFESALQRYK